MRMLLGMLALLVAGCAAAASPPATREYTIAEETYLIYEDGSVSVLQMFR